MKNRESHQFFQCEICDHFFQSEGILQKHIKGHQIEKVARLKVLSAPSVSSYHHKRRKHSKRRRKRSKKEKQRHSDNNNRNSKTDSSISKGNRTSNVNEKYNAEDQVMDIDMVDELESEGKSNNSKISSAGLQVVMDINRSDQLAETQSKGQATVIQDTVPLSQLPGSASTSSSSSNLDVSIPPSPSEVKIQGMDISGHVSANPEIEQAVASIMGPNFEEVSQTLKCNDSENLETDNTIIPLSSGTLEIEKAVSSILGETGLSSVEPIVENNAIIVDIKQNTENPTHSAMLTNNHEFETARGVALEDINAINGFAIERESHGTLIDTKYMSENITMKAGNNSHMANTFEGIETEDTRTKNTNIDISSATLFNDTQSIGISQKSDAFSLDMAPTPTPILTHNAQDIESKNKYNGIDISQQEVGKSFNNSIDTTEVTKLHQEYFGATNDKQDQMSHPSAKVIPSFDVTHPRQFDLTDDSLEKIACANNTDPSMTMPTSLDNLEISNLGRVNNGDVSNHD